MGDYLRYRAAIGNTLSELVILITARAWTQGYEWSAHQPIAAHRDERRRGNRVRLHDGAAEQQKRLRRHLCQSREALRQEGRRRYGGHQRLLHVPRHAAQHGAPPRPGRRAAPAALPELIAGSASAGARNLAPGLLQAARISRIRGRCSRPQYRSPSGKRKLGTPKTPVASAASWTALSSRRPSPSRNASNPETSAPARFSTSLSAAGSSMSSSRFQNRSKTSSL